VLLVERDADGVMTRVVEPGEDPAGAAAESCIHVEFDRITEPALIEQVAADITRVLGDVRAAVEDFSAMTAMAEEAVAELQASPPPVEPAAISEAQDLLRWMASGRFTFLGYRDYDLSSEGAEDVLCSVSGSGLGLLRKDTDGTTTALSPEASRLARARTLLVLTKANSRSTVDRAAYLDYVGIKRFGPSGEVVGERRFLGLYTVRAYSGSAFEIPVVRRKASDVLRRSGYALGSHSEKNLVKVLETYPRDELFQASADELFETTIGIVRMEERHRVRLFARRDPYGRFVSTLVFLPRDRFTTVVRQRVERVLLDAFGAKRSEFTVYLSESVLARLHIILYLHRESPGNVDLVDVEERVAEATRSWMEDLADALIEQCGEEDGVALFHRYRDAFPAAYREDFSPRGAVGDIDRMEHLDDPGDNGLGMVLYRPLEVAEGSLRFKLLRRGSPIQLSEILPVLEHMGVRVVDEHPYEVKCAGGRATWIYDFGLLLRAGDSLETEKIGAAFQEAVAQVISGATEDDGFNRLVLLGGLSWREIVVLRAGCKYLRQTGTTFSQAYMEETLAHHPDIARQLIELFQVRFDPTRQDLAKTESRRLEAAIEAALDGVESLDEDRIIRGYLRLLQAMLRTNYFRFDEPGLERHAGGAGKGEWTAGPRSYLSFKLDPQLLPDLPAPRPAFEIFVYSPAVEGVHLRGAHVARGGIRWSDRREDFRTEILGLMKAQTVKNAVIVPMGAKGGFVVKRPPDGGDRDALAAEGLACYRTFISGLLDLTDNVVGGLIVPPEGVVRYDGDDPYLVVAADKGTATFSDVANAISLERGFWLGDAFASGGSAGYDHKKIGITARGAWESVKSHFCHLGIDGQTTDFTVVGIGDMSGDVFGNGMLLSRHIKLIGAFDHRHVFIDPDPDPERSFEERARLFALARSSWGDFDPAVLSAGGDVFPRTAKSIRLSDEARRALGTESTTVTPAEAIRAILSAPVDLLWNGGIGTYVKATREQNSDAGDRSNDAIRVDASKLRCRVVAEGGNLGLTQAARIEFALAGGLINTDAVDNSAGVDCSDHEVNLKILLDGAVADGDLTLKQRDRLLTEMTDEVTALVLADNIEQNRAVRNADAQAAAMVDVHARMARRLEQTGDLDRRFEHIPDDETFTERASGGRGLTSPEFAVLLAYDKILAYRALLGSDVPDDPYFTREALRYFPSTVRDRFADRIATHALRREIVATALANSVVNKAGTSFIFRMWEETGAKTPDIVRAHAAAWEAFGADRIKEQVEASASLLADGVVVGLRLEVRKLVERATRWIIRNRRPPIDVGATVAFFAPGVEAVAAKLGDLVVGTDAGSLEEVTSELGAAGVPGDLAATVAGLDQLFAALNVTGVAHSLGRPVVPVAEAYYALGDRLGLDWLREQILTLPRTKRWEAMARSALRDDLFNIHAGLVAEALREANDGTGPEAAVDAWLAGNKAVLQRFVSVLSDVKAADQCGLAQLSVVLREIRGLMEGSQTGRAV
jgi:glutamate dehydrogenase